MRLFHCSDIHLGREPYQLDARFDDYARMFRYLCERAVALDVDLVLIGGDLFDRRNINAATLAQATDGLSLLKKAGIPVVAVEGNHDKAFRHDRQFSWMQYLSRAGFLTLLNREHDGGRLILPPWNPKTLRGTWLDVGDVRVYGLGYPGVTTEALMREAATLLPENPEPFTVLLLHAGVGTPETATELGSVSWETLEAFAGKVHLVALGHWHRKVQRRIGEPPFWVLMPGSPEICDIAEVHWEHGFFLVEVNPATKEAAVTFEPTPYRPHSRLRVDVSGCPTPETLLERVRTTPGWETLLTLSEPVVEVILEGRLPFDPLDVRIEEVANVVRERHPCLHVEVVNQANLPPSFREPRGDFLSGRANLERDVLRELVASSPAYAPFAEVVATLALEWKARALEAGENVNDAVMELLEATLDEIESASLSGVTRRLPGLESFDDPS